MVVMKLLMRFCCLFIGLFVCLTMKISSCLVQTFLSFMKSDVIGGAGVECPHVPKRGTCLRLRRPGSRGSLSWLVRYLFPLLLAEVCSQEPDHLQTPNVPAFLPLDENGQGHCIKQLLSYLMVTANGIDFFSKGNY